MNISMENRGHSAADMLRKRTCHIHMVGVCGVGMAGLAFLLKAKGFKVTGCDLCRNRLAEWLEQNGIPVSKGHDANHITPDVKWIIKSTAVPSDTAELSHARELGIPISFRGEVLPELLADYTSVAVCGTHGKTTTTTFITQMLKINGMDPSWCIGGENDLLGGVAGAGAGPNMIVEADESDGTLALYHPDIAVVTNIEFDHMEHFDSVEAFEECFRIFLRNTKRKVIYCADDPRAAKLCGGLAIGISYGFSENAAVKGYELMLGESSFGLSVACGGRELGILELPVPGKHNALNALAATAVGLELGLTFDQIQTALRLVSLPRRRFEKVVDSGGILVISDYAHHPSEVAALIRTAKQHKHTRLLAVYQPHRYTRTLALGPDFPPAFEGLDQLVLSPVYAASEKPLKGGSIWDLYAQFRRQRTEDRGRKTEEDRNNTEGAEHRTFNIGDGTQKQQIMPDNSESIVNGLTSRKRGCSDACLPRRSSLAKAGPHASKPNSPDVDIRRYNFSDPKPRIHPAPFGANVWHIQAKGPGNCQVAVATSLEQAWGYFRHELKSGDVFLVIGAGDVEKIAEWAREEMTEDGRRRTEGENRTWFNNGLHIPVGTPPRIAGQAPSLPRLGGGVRGRLGEPSLPGLKLSRQTTVRFDEPLAGKTTMKVGGKSDVWAEIESESDLREVLKWSHERDIPFHVLGGGSNVVVGDLGVRGVVARLTGKDFRSIIVADGGVKVGAGLPLAGFLDWAEKQGYSGYEFLEGIPGTIGGAVKMNAGAHGAEIGQHILSARCFNSDGLATLIKREELAFAYRRCKAVEDRIIVEAALSLSQRASSEEIRRRRNEIREKRAWWKGLRCAGSVFKNPEGDFAGRLIEEAGFKGLGVGGAVVSTAHANVVVTKEGALASDVRCLIETIRAEVLARFDVNLETEIIFLE